MKTKSLVALAAISVFSTSVMADVMTGKTCLSCHGIETKKVGPAFNDVAKVYAVDVNAKVRFVNSMKGSKGKWGAIPMPPQPTLTPADLDSMFEWIVKQK